MKIILGNRIDNNIRDPLDAVEVQDDDKENGNLNKPSVVPNSAIAQVTPWMYLCGANAVRLQSLNALRVTCIVNATVELPLLPLDGIEVLRVGVVDSPGVDLSAYFDSIADKVEEVREKGGCVLVHCTAGVSRSASLCLAYLMKYQHMPLRKAFAHLRNVRPAVRPNSGFFRQLIDLELRLFGRESVSMVFNEAAGTQIPDVYEVDYQKMVWFQRNYRNVSLARNC
ncbi:Hypothetical predicted protein [Cloeon dipterum]|uniref:Protein-tyrosine-phosphatase n=1 Tax=Cloeon dipterum TaxID=197152 RepID=A0A8S1D100_9INSE|nr:Hypothetical predicted protein [Cloeon dipterum]